MKNVLLYWFKVQASKFMRRELIPLYDVETIKQILFGYWQRYQTLRPEAPALPTLGGLEVHLSDENGSKDGIHDKKCLLEARLEGRQPIAVTALASTYELAVNSAIDKLKASLNTILGRLTDH